MLENIRSHYIIQIIFSLMDLKTWYNLVKYNKSLINKLDINSLYFKNLSTKYVIYGKNRIAREYNIYDDYLEFEGEYSNGKRNGKGKEYNCYDQLIFEGEYLNGKRNGKGKEYHDGRLIFEGEYLNGEKNGPGIEYNGSGKILFEGEYLNGIRWNGKAKDYYSEVELILEIEIINGKGKGKEYHFNEIIYEGEFLNGKRHGKGKLYWNNKLKYEGEFSNGKRNGKGKEYDNNGQLIYEGEYLDGKRLN